VYGITNNLDTTRSQTFTYDQLNRIASALTTSNHSTSPSHCWGEAYTVDAWGNLLSIAATTNPAYIGCTVESGFTKTADGSNHVSGLSYDASGNTSNDGTYTYNWDGESQLKSAGGVNYLYDGNGRRVAKTGSKLYWYGSGGEILAETNSLGTMINEYIFFGGQRIAMIPSGSAPNYYIEDLLGTSRVITTSMGVSCYDADFYPYGVERAPYTNTCTQNNYKFEGKERDTETFNDDFGARYYSNRFGRWLSADWSDIPVAIPYAKPANPQTLNLYAMVADDPESFADLDGHAGDDIIQYPLPHGLCNPSCHYIGADGHHLITLWRDLGGTGVGALLRALKTGALVDPTTNYFNALHRGYNEAVAEIRAKMEQELKKSLSKFTKEEVTQLARRIYDSADSRVTKFVDSLSKTRTGLTAREALKSAIESIEDVGKGAMDSTPIFCIKCDLQLSPNSGVPQA